MNENAAPSRLSRLLDIALDLPPNARATWLDSLDATHDDIRPRLRALLARAAQIEAGDFLTTIPPLPDDPDAADAASFEAAGMRVGAYRLERQLGTGGMGTVWLASRADGLFERALALKLPHRGMFGADLAERMARERQILAALDHPNIARLYDAGLTDDGQPYLALEYVEGEPIDEYCRRHACSLDQRLRLFLQVADAVAAAHARLVVHRDLKPANILVTADGDARLLDFGIAKLLDASAGAAGLTQLTARAFTPDYASPEQIRGASVTIAADVYSLGVILYELLCGERPYRLRRDTRGALEDAILDVEPRRPSSIGGARALRGDLDTIVLKALRKAPEERYATVNSFADDLRRHLAGHPVLARPDGSWYRASRFLRRHALGVAVAAGVTVAILVAAGMALWQAQAARSERRHAEEVNAFIKSIFTNADPFEGGGHELSALDLLKQARGRVDHDFVGRPEQRVELLNTLTVSLANLGDYDAADESSRTALAVALRELPPASPVRREARIARLDVHRMRGRNSELRREVDALLAEPHPDPALRAADRARLLIFSAHAAIDTGDNERAARDATEAFELAARVLAPGNPSLLEAAVVQSVAYRFAGQLSLAEPAARRALDAALAAANGNPANARVLDARMALGSIYEDFGKPSAAITELEAALGDAARVYGEDSEFETYVHSFLARAYCEYGDLPKALTHIDRTLTLTRSQADEESRNLGIATAIRAHILAQRGDFAGAVAGFDTALPIYQKLYGPEHDGTLGVRVERALALAHAGQHARALAELRLIAAQTKEVKHWMVVSPAYALGVAQRLAGDARGALATQRSALAGLPDSPRRDFLRMAVLGELGASALAAGEEAEGAGALREALALHARLEVAATPARREIEALLARRR